MMAAVLIGVSASAAFAETVTPKAMATGNSSIPTPAIRTTEGIVSALDVQSSTPWIQVKQADGHEAMIQIGRTATAWKEGKKTIWANVKLNEKVKVRHMTKEGKEVAKTVEIES